MVSESPNRNFGLVYFFCDHRSDEKQTFDNFLITAVRQLAGQDLKSYDSTQAHVPSKKGKSHLQVPDYPAILRTLSIRFGSIYIIVNALDESTEEEVFIEGFRDILSAQPDTKPFKILIASRHSLKIERLLVPMAVSQLSLNERTGSDIVKFVTNEIESRVRSRKLKLRNQALASRIENALTGRNDTLWVYASENVQVY
jgi:hypothetical protein